MTDKTTETEKPRTLYVKVQNCNQGFAVKRYIASEGEKCSPYLAHGVYSYIRAEILDAHFILTSTPGNICGKHCYGSDRCYEVFGIEDIGKPKRVTQRLYNRAKEEAIKEFNIEQRRDDAEKNQKYKNLVEIIEFVDLQKQTDDLTSSVNELM